MQAVKELFFLQIEMQLLYSCNNQSLVPLMLAMSGLFECSPTGLLLPAGKSLASQLYERCHVDKLSCTNPTHGQVVHCVPRNWQAELHISQEASCALSSNSPCSLFGISGRQRYPQQELAREGTSHHLLFFIAITKIRTSLGFVLRDRQ